MKGSWCLLHFVVFSAISLVAQPAATNLHFNHLSTANGLSQNINLFFHKDKQGFVWISSVDGLNRFDGQTVRVYRPESGNQRSLVGNNMQSPFFEDEEGNLWFGTVGAINCYRPQTDDFSSFTVEVKGKPFTSSYYVIHRDRQGKLWTRLNDTLYVITPPLNDTSEAVMRVMGRFPGVRQLIIPDKNENIAYLWAYGYTDSLHCFRLLGDTAMVSIPSMQPKNIPLPHQITQGINNTAWFCTKAGLFHVDCNTGKMLDHIHDFEGESIGSVFDLEDFGEKTAYVSSERGLFVLDKINRRFVQQFVHHPEKPSSLASSSDMLYNVYIDRDAVLWVSIWTKGVDYASINKAKFKTIGYDQLLLPKETAFSTDALLLDDNRDLWLGSNMSDLRVLRRTKKRAEKVTGPNGTDLNIEYMLRLRSGDVLMRGRHKNMPRGDKKLYLYDISKQRLHDLPNPPSINNIFDHLLLQNNEILVTTDSAIYQLELNADFTPKWSNILVNGIPKGKRSFWRIFQDSRGRIYISDQENNVDVFTYQNGMLSWITRFPFSDEINAITETDSLLWISSRAMLGFYQSTDIVHGREPRPDTILNRTVYGLLTANSGNLWFSTNNGIMCLRPGEKIPKQYHLSDGLQGYEYNASAYQKTPDGQLWLGGVDGVNFFHPDSVRDIQTRAPVLLTGLKVNDEPYSSKTNISLLDTLELEYVQNTLSFDFVVADYSDPQNTQHWYQMTRLDGDSPDKDWIKGQSALGFARYANLAPGKYLFKIKGANADGVVNPDLRTVFIVIHPPFWQTWWFITLCLLAGAMATYAGIRYYIRENLRLKNLQLREQRLQIEKQDALTKERNRIAGEMHDDLGGGLTSIRMLSERLTAKTDNPDMKNAVDKIADHAQSLVLRMSEIIWAMNSNFDTVDNLIAYIRRYSAEYLDEHHLRSVIHVPQNVPDLSISGEKRRNMYLAVKESLHNIVKHARAERVNIDFEIENNQLVITVHDNGQGIDPGLLNQFGNGLYNMKKRLEDIGGTMTLANDEGTLITFTMPLNNQDS